jgi:hypothetical protein
MTEQRRISLHDLPQIIGMIFAIYFFISYFVKGGLPETADLLNIITWTLPFVEIVGIIRLFQTFYYRARGGKTEEKTLLSIFIVMFLATVLVSQTYGIGSVNFLFFYNAIANAGQAGIFLIITLSLITSYMRAYSRRRLVSALMLGLTSIALITSTPLNVMLPPQISIFGNWFNSYIVANVYFAVFLGIYIATLMFFVRLGLLKERIVSPEK